MLLVLSCTNFHSSRFFGGVFRNAFMMFSGVSGMGSGSLCSTGRPLGFLDSVMVSSIHSWHSVAVARIVCRCCSLLGYKGRTRVHGLRCGLIRRQNAGYCDRVANNENRRKPGHTLGTAFHAGPRGIRTFALCSSSCLLAL